MQIENYFLDKPQHACHYQVAALPTLPSEATYHIPVPSDQIVQYVEKNLLQMGALQKNSSNFVYVDLDDAYIHNLVHFIESEGFIEPPYFEEFDSVGAHITVISKEEFEMVQIDKIEELGQPISFTIKECQRVQPPQFNGMLEVYLITVTAPALEIIRARYNLPQQLYEFHITIGVKPL